MMFLLRYVTFLQVFVTFLYHSFCIFVISLQRFLTNEAN